MVPDPDRLDLGTDRQHHARALVTENGRLRDRDHAVTSEEVGMAKPDSGDLDEDLVVAGLIERDGLDVEETSRLAADRGLNFHR